MHGRRVWKSNNFSSVTAIVNVRESIGICFHSKGKWNDGMQKK